MTLAAASPLDLIAGRQTALIAGAAAFGLGACLVLLARTRRRRARSYVRLRVTPYRGEDASAEAIVAMFEALHKRLLRRWWRRLLAGQPSIALEAHVGVEAWLAVSFPRGLERMVLSALRGAYPNCLLEDPIARVGPPPAVLRLKKEQLFIKRVKSIDRFEHEREPFMNRLLRTLASGEGPAFVQLAMTPARPGFERRAKRLYKRHEHELSRARGAGLLEPRLDRSMVEDAELRGGLDVQHRPLFFVDVRVIAGDRGSCERTASSLRAEVAENRLVERGTAIRHGLLGLYQGRVLRGEGNPLPCTRKGVFASTELAAMWHLPSLDFLAVPLRRSSVPVAPAPAAILRPTQGTGTLRDAKGPVSIHSSLRRQNTAVVGTVEQGKSSYLVASIVEDLARSRCAVVLLDPKGDAAEAALGNVPAERVCTLLDFAHPTCGFNPLAVDAPADVIADYVVAALKGLFDEADIRASSDRYLRNAIIAVLAYDRSSTLWDAARLLSVGPEGYEYRARVGARVRELPELKEISDFFTAELSVQLADARSTTTAKLDAPVNKLARLLNSPSIKRVLLNDSLRVDFERLIRNAEVLIVKGALGSMGVGNTSVLMQLMVGMLDAALARQQDLVPPPQRIAVALKVDEAPLVLNRGFVETMALKRSAGLETVACWQVNAQWVEREVRDQLDALFAHRVYFATASAEDARESSALAMTQFSDLVRPDMQRLSVLGRPDARLHLPKHHAIVSWSTPAGRQLPFVARTLPMHVDRQRLAMHAARQQARGGRYLADLSRSHWDQRRPDDDDQTAEAVRDRAARAEERRGTRSEAPIRPAEQGAHLQSLPDAAAASYAELVAVDCARRARRMPRGEATGQQRLDAKDLQMLGSLATFRHMLSSQLHRRHAGGTAVTGTDTLAVDGSLPLNAVRRDLHLAGWALALEQTIAGRPLRWAGAAIAGISAPLHARGGGEAALRPSDLRLPGGRVAHDFLCAGAEGETREVDRFETVRPALRLLASSFVAQAQSAHPVSRIDLLVEGDDRCGTESWNAKVRRYDHFVTGWSLHLPRHGRHGVGLCVVFVCRDRSRARECACQADMLLLANRAYAGERPDRWLYTGQERILFVAERDAHEGLLGGYAVPALPPRVRAKARARAIEQREVNVCTRSIGALLGLQGEGQR